VATPDFDHTPNEVDWTIQPNYVIPDNDGRMVCAMTGFAQRKGEVVYRGSYIDEFIGFYAIGQDSAEQLARLIGFVDPDSIDKVVADAVSDKIRVEELEIQVAHLELMIEAYQTIEFHEANEAGNEEVAE